MSLNGIIGECVNRGIQLWTEDGNLHFKSRAGALDDELKASLKQMKPQLILYLEEVKKNKVQADEEGRYESFPVTEIQSAYLMGRNKAYQYGGIGCKIYAEFAAGFTDTARFSQAVKDLVRRHDMLRVKAGREGTQKIEEKLSGLPVRILDLSHSPQADQEKTAENIRRELQFKQYDPEKDALFDIVLCILGESRSVLYLSLDMLLGDFLSIDIVVKDLERLYAGENMTPLTMTFRDYILYQEKEKQSMEYLSSCQRDREYWQKRMDSLPGSPQLPVNERPKIIAGGGFYHKEYLVRRGEWEQLEENAKMYGVTPTSVVLAAYAKVLGMWSKNKDFLLNITTMNRPRVHHQIEEVIGDFTTTTLLEVKNIGTGSFAGYVKEIQGRLFEDLSHNTFSGMDVLRELNRKERGKLVPYVFTSTIGAQPKDGGLSRLELLYKISQTPQVLIDCQVSRQKEGVLINWDVREGVFSETMVREMFEVFQAFILELSRDSSQWEKDKSLTLPEKTRNIRNKVNAAKILFPKKSLMTDIYENFEIRRQKTAVIHEGRRYSYGELAVRVAWMQNALKEKGAGEGDRIGILLGKGIWQTASVLAAVSIGAVYVPIDPAQPKQRRRTIMEQAGIRINVVGDCAGKETGAECILVPGDEEVTEAEPFFREISPEKPAYLIFTSGSTGVPKGVEMTHGGAVNTIEDMRQKFHLTGEDVVLGVSNLFFDLSVFDIFGTLSSGGALVLPAEEKKKDVSHWAALCKNYGVTVLNMVPAQMEMLVAYGESGSEKIGDSIRLILLSGDWIPASLIKKIGIRLKDAECIGLGGATEAGIWSIYYPCAQLRPGDENVPYGLPLSNQRFYILDENNQPCPDFVPGELCIAGDSLALGYLNDRKLSDEKFQYVEEIKERVYRTGDLGRYREDGVIEFLGRKDTQTKLNGYRIELGEIENAVKQYPGAANAVVLKENENRLAAYVVSEKVSVSSHKAEVREADEEELNISFDQDEFRRWVDLADETALMYIIKTFREAHVFEKRGKKYAFEEISRALDLHPDYRQLVKRWLAALKKEGVLGEEGGLYFIQKEIPEGMAERTEEKWREADSNIRYSDTLMDYMHQSACQLKELLSGKVHPHHLLFPEGKLHVEFAAYKDNVVSRSLNAVMRKEVLKLAEEAKERGEKIRILEVGAGAGGSSMELIRQLGAYQAEYYFTDVSKFFFDAAKKNLIDCPWVEYKIYDINKANWEQGFEHQEFDVILCTNVLHNAENLDKTLRNLKELIRGDGQLIIAEEVRERYALFTSVEFEFAKAARSYAEEEERETIFTKREEWKKKLESLGGDIVLTYPKESDRLYPAGQELMAVKFHESQKLDEEELKAFLKNRLPEYMIPKRIIAVSELPVTDNGKIDRKALKNALENAQKEQDPEDGQGEILDDLEERIRKIWCDVIGCKTIKKEDDFYSIGGDSLLIAQVTSRMRNQLPEAKGWEWDRLMQELMKNATIKTIASRLREKGEEQTAVRGSLKVSPLVPFVMPEGRAETMKVLFHAGTGTLSSYKELLPYLVKGCGPKDSLVGFNFGDAEEYLSRPADTFIIETAKKYADILMEQEAERFELVGYCVGGWIAFETAKIMMEKGREAACVTTISTSLCAHNMDNEILLERAFGLSIGADIERAGYMGDNQLLQKALSEIKTKDEQNKITEKELCGLSGEYKDIGEGFRKLCRMDQRERLKSLYESLEQPKEYDGGDDVQMFELIYRLFSHSFRGVMRYEPSAYTGDVQALFVEDDTRHFFPVGDVSSQELWESLVLGDLRIGTIPGEHGDCLKEPNSKAVASQII